MYTLCAYCGSAIRYGGAWTHSAPGGDWGHKAQVPRFWLDSRAAADIVLRHELILLWDDLIHARRFAHDRWSHWSFDCENIAHRIRRVSGLVGPVDWRNIGIPFLLSIDEYQGWGYQETAERANLPITIPTAEEAEETTALYRSTRHTT